MGKTFRPWSPEQRLLLPPAVEEFVPPSHLAHFVRDVVRDELDLTAILAAYTDERGSPPYDAAMMTALLLYGYGVGVYASRRLARACEERVDCMAVTAMQRPDFRTISEFRRRHLGALSALFQQVLALCARAGLVRLGHVAVDSTKIKANASKHKAMSYGRMKEREARLAAEVARWLAEAAAADAADDAAHGPDRRGDELPEWVADKAERLKRLRAAKAALEAEARAAAEHPEDAARKKKGPPSGTPADRAQRNFTDPQSRIMKGPGGDYVQAYNGQAAVDADSQVIVAQELNNVAADAPALPRLVTQIKANTGRQTAEVSADSAYCSEANLTTLVRHHIRAYVAIGRGHHDEPVPTTRDRAPRGPRVRAMIRRLRRGGWRSRYRLRKQTAEPVFGQMKQARGFRQFLLRGLAKTGGEWSLVCTAHNLLKLAAARA